MKNNSFIYYTNLSENKTKIYKDNLNKSGVYRFINLLTYKSYIGSSINLTNRFKKYYSVNYIKNKLLLNKSYIYKAILDEGISNFKLEILEYCDKKYILSREQYYMDTLNPEYNILKFAGSSLGFKHSPETILKFKNRKLNLGCSIVILNKHNNIRKEYNSIREAARNLGVNRTRLSNYINNNKLLNDTFLVFNFSKPEVMLYNDIGTKIRVFNTTENFSIEFQSIRSVARFIGSRYSIIVSTDTISKYARSGKIYKENFYFEFLHN